jgi:hypothetical protein
MAKDDDTDRSSMRSTGLTPNSAKALKKFTPQERAKWIASRARMVIGAYRKDDFADPDSFAIQLGIVLEGYADTTIEQATDPRTGIQRECKFPPTIAEFVAFCDEIKRRATYSAEYDARSARQLAERKAFEEQDARESLEHRIAVANRIKAELRTKGFTFAGDTPRANTVAQEREKLLALGKITPEQFDALPDLPKSPDYWQGIRWPNPQT